MMRNIKQHFIQAFLCMLIFTAVISCKSKAVVAEGKASGELSSKEIISKHYKNKKNYKTLSIRADARYKDADNSQNVSIDIRIKKDEKILVSVRFLGITMAKALVTPTSVQYYEKINGNYFEGDYSTLSKWLGTDLDFNKVQNLLTGEALDDLTKSDFATSIEDKLYKLQNTTAKTEKEFYFEGERFLIKKQQISQPAQNRMLKVWYPNHKQYGEIILPAGINIEAMQQKGKATIDITYNSATFDEELSFPYSVPDGYDRIFID